MTVPPQGMRLAVLGSLLGSLVLLAGIIWTGRLTGALATPLAWPWLITVGVLLAAACGACRIVWLRDGAKPSRWLDQVARWGPLAGVILFCSAILLPDTSVAAGAVFLAVLAIEQWYSCSYLPWGPPLDDSILQQVTRRRAADGQETVQGWLRLDLQPGQRTAVGHLAFCPPFDRIPHVTARQIDGPEARVRLEQALAFGARVEVKLRENACDATDVLVELTAVSSD